MVFWGPWQQGLIYQQRLTSTADGGYLSEWLGQASPDAELAPISGDDTPVSGWYLSNSGEQSGFTVLGTAVMHHESPLDVEPEGSIPNMLLALNAARTNVTDNAVSPTETLADWVVTHEMDYEGLGSWRQNDEYRFSGRIFTLHHHGYQSTGLNAGVPEFDSWPEGATIAVMEPVAPLVVSEDPYVVQEGAHTNFVLNLEDAVVETWAHAGSVEGPIASWSGFVRTTSTQEGWLGEGSMNGFVRANPTFAGGQNLDVTELRQLMIDDALLTNPWAPSIPEPDLDLPHTDLRWPQFTVAITEETIGSPTATCDAETGPSVLLTFRTPRYRFGYDEPVAVPYRRTYPRDDGLAGGAPRTWPPSKGVQSSNRTFGGYL